MADLSLLSITKPARYMGGEFNSIKKEEKEVNWVLIYPDAYEVGMSSLGIQILYSILNSRDWIRAERCFAPLPDYEQFLRKRNEPLKSLESGIPLYKFDVIGVSVTTELNYTNILLCLDLGGLPLRRYYRKGFPLVIAGGPNCVNPAPLEDFFDAFFIGEGEEGVIEISEVVREGKKNHLSKTEILKELAKIEGVYVPDFPKGLPVKRRIIPDIDLSPHPLNPVLPNVSTVHDRAVVEIARGCTKGCRFCLAGFITRPVRERSPQNVVRIAKEILHNTGYEQISFLSLNTCDYTRINEIVLSIIDYLDAKKISLSLPSIRIGTLSEEVLKGIGRVMKTGITLAPETGSEKLRRIINKPFSNEELMKDVETAVKCGWEHLKLYFMIGLPCETEDDREEIVRLVEEVLKLGVRINPRFRLSVHISQFVPKPHTPFQWEKQVGVEETFEMLKYLKKKIARRNVKVKYQLPSISFIEGILARGDRRTGDVVERAYLRGARFDGWTEFFRMDSWNDAFNEIDFDPEEYLKEREGVELPWTVIDPGVTQEFLMRERERAFKGYELHDCFRGKCYKCGVCDFKSVEPVSKGEIPRPLSPAVVPTNSRFKFRIRITKEGIMKFLGYTDYTLAFERGLRRSGLPILFSKGYHPRPKVSYGFPAPVGVESIAEYVDVELGERISPHEVLKKLTVCLPEGMRVLEVEEIPENKTSIFSSTCGFVYEFYSEDGEVFRAIDVNNLENSPSYKDYISDFRISNGYLEVVIKVINGRTLSPYKFIEIIWGEDLKDRIRVLRREVLLK